VLRKTESLLAVEELTEMLPTRLLAPYRHPTLFRTMSTAVSHKFLVYAPDKTDEGAAARRYKVRPRHMEGMAPLIKSGIIKVAGMSMTPESINREGEDRIPVGSVLIVEGNTLEEVRNMIESDIYYTSGVWDPEKLVILPFLSALAL